MKRNKIGHIINQNGADLFAGRAFLVDKETGGKKPVSLKLPENTKFAADLKMLQNDVETSDQATINQKVFDLQSAHYNRCQKKKAEIEAEMQTVKKRYEADNREDPAESLLRLERYKAICEVQTNDVLTKLLSDADSADTWEKKAACNPDELMAAAAALQHRGKTTEAGLLSNALERIHYGKPWLNTPEGDRLSKVHDMYDVEFGMVRTSADVSGIAIDYLITELIEGE